jgi:DNA-binding NarL/FixJ family response regulator
MIRGSSEDLAKLIRGYAVMSGTYKKRGPARRERIEAAKIATLTCREREIISLIGEGLKNKQIAARLYISETTVRHHLTSVFDKLGVADRLELVIYAFHHGLVEPHP